MGYGSNALATISKRSLWANFLVAAGAHPVFCNMKRLVELFLLPLDGMLVHCKSLLRNLFIGFPQQFDGTQLCWKLPVSAQEHNSAPSHAGIDPMYEMCTERYTDVWWSICIRSVQYSTITLEEVSSDLLILPTQKAVEPDGISNILLKEFAPELAPLIQDI